MAACFIPRYVLYIRPGGDMEKLLSTPRTAKWVRRGILVPILWDDIRIPDGCSGYTDQRLIYNHAGK